MILIRPVNNRYYLQAFTVRRHKLEILEFCKLIQKEYLFYLYKHKIVFPYCCHTSANLIASYFHVHFDEKYEHKVCEKRRHGWAANNDQMIDFTGFQFFISDAIEEQFRNQAKNIKRDEFVEIIDLYTSMSPILCEQSTEHFNSFNNFGSITNSELYGIEIAKQTNDPFTLGGFMNYVEQALELVDEKVVKSGLYR